MRLDKKRTGMMTTLAALTMFAAACGQQESKRARQSAGDAFIPLFDGKTLAGWDVEPKTKASDWIVRDGVIVGHGGKGQSYLAWKDKGLTDFELKLSYRLPRKGNTGIDIRGRPVLTGRRRFESYHADLGHVGIGPHILGAWDFHFTKRKEYPCNRGTRLVIDADGKAHSSKISGAVTLADIRRQQWNDVCIIARGNHFKFFINGKISSEFTDNAKQGRLDKGVIRLQIHDRGMHVEFKDIRLKQLTSVSQSEKPVPVGLQKQLFVDDYVVAKKENVTLEVGQAKKYGVVMKPTLATDFQSGKVHDGPDGGYGFESPFCWHISPHWDPNKKMFRLWYMAGKREGSGLAYGESKDGIHWTKPMVSKDGKSNLVLAFGLDGVTVTIDPNVPQGAPDKFKCAYFPIKGPCQTRLGYSADGISWKFYNQGKPVTGRAADFSNQIVWDPIRKRYLLLCRQDFAGGGGIGELRGVRIMEHSKANDLIKHPTAWKTLTTFLLKDPDKTVIPGTKTPQRQIHTFPIWYYEGVWFGLTDILAATNKHLKKGTQDYHTRHDRGVWDFYMAPSRDGIKYDFTAAAYPRKALIPRGPAGSFDKDCVRPPSNIITHNDEHWIYYLATNERWGCHKWDARLALAKLRLDGFFYLEAKEKPGTVVTKPFKLEGDKLEVNVDARAGWVQVELLDETDKEIPGFSGKAAKQHKGVDQLRLAPKWKSGGDLSRLKGKTVKLKFTLRNAKLYAFDFNQQESAN